MRPFLARRQPRYPQRPQKRPSVLVWGALGPQPLWVQVVSCRPWLVAQARWRVKSAHNMCRIG